MSRDVAMPLRDPLPARRGLALASAVLLVGGLTLASVAAASTPYEEVDPFIGTGGEGHTYPGATMPWGMVQLSPDTDVRFFRQSFPWAAGYRFGDPTILGFSHTHFSGTGHSDQGDVLLMPTVGPLQLTPGTAEDPTPATDHVFRTPPSVPSPATTPSISTIRTSTSS